MFYRESGQFKTSYAADQAIFPIKQDNWGMVLLLLIAFFAVPYFGTEYFFRQISGRKTQNKLFIHGGKIIPQ